MLVLSQPEWQLDMKAVEVETLNPKLFLCMIHASKNTNDKPQK